ncbi:Protein of unknown function [Bacillus mycoides]|nr:Protein of unknown function [Bacillus mycoides]
MVKVQKPDFIVISVEGCMNSTKMEM